MSLIKKNVKAIEANPELQAKLKELWNQDAPVSDFYDVLSSAGLDVTLENLEDTHAELQKRRGETIATLEKVDRGQLAKVAGGGTGVDCTGAGDCDVQFKDWSGTSSDVRCNFDFFCDEYYNTRSD